MVGIEAAGGWQGQLVARVAQQQEEWTLEQFMEDLNKIRLTATVTGAG
jgi:hypothetical protein